MKLITRMKFRLIEIIESFWVPIVFLILSAFILFKYANIKDTQTFQVVLGIVLGVVLGFTADITKRSFDELQNRTRIKKTSLKLLKNEAQGVYRTFYLYENMQKSENAPFDTRACLPPKLDLTYWSFLKKEKDFLLLASKPPFDRIFELIWKLEKINDQVEKAEKGDKQALGFAIAICNQTIKDKLHEKLLLIFISHVEFDKFKETAFRAHR